MKNLFKDLAIKSKAMADFIKALAEYLVLKNQILWEGTLSANNTITVPNINKYSMLVVRTPYADVIGYIDGGNRFRGWASDYSNGSNVHYDNFVLANIDGDKFKLLYAQYMGHINGGAHSGVTEFSINRIVGLEPKVPDNLKTNLQKIFGGGYSLTRLLKRWCSYENIHHLKADNNFNPKLKISHNRQQYTRKWLCNISKWPKIVLGIFQWPKVGWSSYTANNIYKRTCDDVSRIFVYRIVESALQLWNFFEQEQHKFVSIRQFDTRQLHINQIIWNLLSNRILTVRGCNICYNF